MQLEYIPFLREVGRHFTINRMLTFDSVKLRLDREQPLTFLEFNYMILQAYDFLELSRRVGCRLQMGGSDQWGNIVNGIELGAADRRDRAVRPHHAADHHRRRRQDGQDRAGRGVAQRRASSARTITGSSGGTPHDADVGRFLRLFTDLPLDEIARLESLPGAEINQAKIVLATEATAMLHGREAARCRGSTPRTTTFDGGGAGEDLPTLSLGDGMTIRACADRHSAFARRTAKPSARSPKARCGSTMWWSAIPALTLTAGDEP